MKVGDGTTLWNALGYLAGGSSSVAWGDITGIPAAVSGTTASFTTTQETKLAGIATGATANAADSALRDRATHTGTQAAATITGLATVATTGAYSSLTGIPSTFAPSAHTHVIADVTGLQSALDGKQPLATVLTNTTAAFTTVQETKLAGIATGATVNAADAALRDRTTHTGTQAAATISDFDTASRAQTEAMLVAGTNVTLTPSGSGATRQLTIAASGGGGGSTDPLDLSSETPAPPPADTVRLFRREIAGRQFPAFMGPSGLDSALQPLLARNKVGYWCPPGNANTVPGVLGFTAPTITGFTATARNVATTNLFTRMRRLGYVSAATAAAVGQWRFASGQFTTGGASGLGGFTYVIRFGISDAALVSGARMFMGLRASATPTNVEPSTLTNCIGIGHGAADTTMRLYYGGSAAQTPIDLGADFPVSTNTDPFDLSLFSPPNSAEIRWQVTNLRTGVTATGTVSGGAAVIPQETTLICPWGYRTNNATAAAVALDVMSAYIETDF
jgi:hypothetical protein